MRNIINYSTIIFSFALAASFLSSTLAIDLKLKNYNKKSFWLDKKNKIEKIEDLKNQY